MSDLVKRLRVRDKCHATKLSLKRLDGCVCDGCLIREAADRIEAAERLLDEMQRSSPFEDLYRNVCLNVVKLEAERDELRRQLVARVDQWDETYERAERAEAQAGRYQKALWFIAHSNEHPIEFLDIATRALREPEEKTDE
jgi:hypothetical protein